jgi:hypothetical protein
MTFSNLEYVRHCRLGLDLWVWGPQYGRFGSIVLIVTSR